MDRFFSFLGRIFAVLFLVGVLAGGGYYFHTKLVQQKKVSPTLSPTAAQGRLDVFPTASISSEGFRISAGGIAPFVAYTLTKTEGWSSTISHTTNPLSDKLVLAKGEYLVIILQGAFGGGPCLFSGDNVQDMGTPLSNPHDILLSSGILLRRGQAQVSNSANASFMICQKGKDENFGTITSFGAINYTTPFHPDSQVLAEMDAMVGSLKKQ